MPERPFFLPSISPRNVPFYGWGASECQLTWEDESVLSVLSGPFRAEGKTHKFAVAFPHLKMPGKERREGGRGGGRELRMGGRERRRERGRMQSTVLPATHKVFPFLSFCVSLTLSVFLFLFPPFLSPFTPSDCLPHTAVQLQTHALKRHLPFVFYRPDGHSSHQGLLRCPAFPPAELIPALFLEKGTSGSTHPLSTASTQHHPSPPHHCRRMSPIVFAVRST